MKTKNIEYELKHKYIRVYDNENQYNEDVQNHELEECAYCLVNKSNNTNKANYQPSHRTTNDDDKKLMPYFTKDNIILWAGLKIIWGYYGWEENKYTLNGEELLGGKCYKVREMTTLKSVPDLYQYQHLNYFLKDVNTVTTYEQQDFSTIKSASHLVNLSGVTADIFTLPSCYSNLNNLVNVVGPLFVIGSKNVKFDGNKINIDNLTDIKGSNFPFDTPANVYAPPVLSINSIRELDDAFWNYENRYIKAWSNSITKIIDSIKAYTKLHDINKTSYLINIDTSAIITYKAEIKITDNYFNFYSDDVDFNQLFNIKSYNINININKKLICKSTPSQIYLENKSTYDEDKKIKIDKLNVDFSNVRNSESFSIKSINGNIELNNLNFEGIYAAYYINKNSGFFEFPSDDEINNSNVSINNSTFEIINNTLTCYIFGNINISNVTFNGSFTADYTNFAIYLNNLNTVSNLNFNNLPDITLRINTVDNTNCFDNIFITNCDNISIKAYNNIKFANSVKNNTIYNNNFEEISLDISNIQDINYTYTDNENKLKRFSITSSKTLEDGNFNIVIPNKIYDSINLTLNIDFNGTHTRNISFLSNDVKFRNNCTINTNFKKNITAIYLFDDDNTFALNTINIYKDSTYERKVIIENTKSTDTYPTITLYINDFTNFKLYNSENSIRNIIRIYNINTSGCEELDFTDFYLIYTGENAWETKLATNTFKITETTFSKLKLKHYIASLDYGELCDELNFSIVKSTILGNSDNPNLGKSSAFNPSRINLLKLSRKLYNKFTESEKTTINQIFKTVTISENANQ